MAQPKPALDRVGVVGTGSMGRGMALLFAEYGTKVFYYDPNDDNANRLREEADRYHLDKIIRRAESYEDLCKLLEDPEQSRFLVFSIPHGNVGDQVVDGLWPSLTKGDVIIDASNEYWKHTEDRQHKLEPHGIHYIGAGVSGGYQAARHGPSISPGGAKEALLKARPFLEQIAAKDRQGRSCTVPVGPAGSGHYVKMVHNGIEQAMMSIICEVWGIMTAGLGLSSDEVSSIFFEWSQTGVLRQNFLVAIGGDICRTKDQQGTHVLSTVRDKVVQDVEGSEGTGTWTVEESAHLHVSCPSIATAHLFRLASADLVKRLDAGKALGETHPQRLSLGSSREEAMKVLQEATYSTFLMSFIQGLHLIKAASEEYRWDLNLANLMQLWKGGCIIQSDHIVELLERTLSKPGTQQDNLLRESDIANELKGTTASLKKVIVQSTLTDQFVPCLSQSWEWYKYSTSTNLPTQFMEAELDYFGYHMFDKKDDPPGTPVTGKHHYEWHPAKGINEPFQGIPQA